MMVRKFLLSSPIETLTALISEFGVFNFIWNSFWPLTPFKTVWTDHCEQSCFYHMTHDLWSSSLGESEDHVSNQWWTRFFPKRVWWDEHRLTWWQASETFSLDLTDRIWQDFWGWRAGAMHHRNGHRIPDGVTVIGMKSWEIFSLNETTPSAHNTFSLHLSFLELKFYTNSSVSLWKVFLNN